MSEGIGRKRLVFLVGAPRSGTTWLQLMLASSDAVVTANETHLFSAYLTSLFNGWRSFKHKRVPREIGLHHLISEEEWRALIRSVASRIFARILQRKPEARVLLEKTPAHILHARDILEIFPDAYFLHLARDPRSVVASLHSVKATWWRHFPGGSTVSNCRLWKRRVEQGRKIGNVTSNFLEVRYEDLKTDGENSLFTIFSWMGVDCTLGECRRILKTHSIEVLKSGDLKNQPWNISAEPPGFFRLGTIDGWRSELTNIQIWLVELITRDLMSVYGYRRVSGRLSTSRKTVEEAAIQTWRWMVQLGRGKWLRKQKR